MRRILVMFTLASALAAPAFADDNRIITPAMKLKLAA